jgi:hypothetical protein
VKIMFLGGSLDHAIRDVELVAFKGFPETVVVTRLSIPPSFGGDESRVEPDPPRELYRRVEVDASPRKWHAYVLDGHNPPRQHLVDAMPNWLGGKR